MKQTIIQIKKLAIRSLMAVGAVLGLTSCPRSAQECVYGPPPGVATMQSRDTIQVRKLVYGPRPMYRRDTLQVVEDVYGPPVEMKDTTEHGDEALPENNVD